MRENIYSLIKMINEGEVTAYKVFKISGVSQIQISNLKNGKILIDNIAFKTAEALNQAYLEIRNIK